MNDLRPNKQRSNVVIIFIYIYLMVSVLSLLSDVKELILIQNYIDTNEMDMAEAESNDLRQQIIAYVSLAITFVTGVFYIRWFRRAYFNLHLKVGKLSFGEGMAAGSWFIPIVSLFRPFQIMKELFVESKKVLFDTMKTEEIETPYHLLGFWWTFWVTSNIVGQIVFRLSLHIETGKDMLYANYASMGSLLIEIPLCILAIMVIKKYSLIEDLLMNQKEYEFGQSEDFPAKS